ncbi:hypothetical protein BGZ73_006677 [Actinomortierella ambigua]|nr:hypothetical protein BGZ73_006677 [Actinomortierella ambigua]
MDCIFQVHRSSSHLSLHKRAPPFPPPPGSPPPSLEPTTGTGSAGPSPTGTAGSDGGQTAGMSEADQRTVIIAASIGGTLLLVIALAIFSICLKKRRASRRIHQLQGFLPTFLDKDRTERYFREKPLSRNSSLRRHVSSAKGQTAAAATATTAAVDNNTSQVTLHENASHSTLVTPPSQAVVSNLHNRAKAAPLARQHSLEKQGSGVFQQVLLDPSEPSSEENQQQQQQPPAEAGGGGILGAIRRSISIRTANKDSVKQQQQQKQQGPSTPTEGSPSVLIGERGLQQLPQRGSSGELTRFPEGEDHRLSISGRGVPSSSSVEYQMSRFSSTSSQGGLGELGNSSSNDMLLLDPNRFSTMSVMFDARQLEEHQLQQEAAHQMYYQSNMDAPRTPMSTATTATATPPSAGSHGSSNSGGHDQTPGARLHPHHHRVSGLSRQSTESGSSANSSDDDNAVISQLPEHQRLQAFHAPPPLTSPGTPSFSPAPPTAMPVQYPGGTQLFPQQYGTGGAPSFNDKQELDEDEDDAQPTQMLLPTHTPQPAPGPWPSAGPPMQPQQQQQQQNLQPVIGRAHGGREMSLSASDRELDTSY